MSDQLLSIYLVEDDPVFRDTLAQAVQDAPDLRLSGIANDLAGGMELLERGPVDVFLVDLGLPDGSGLTLIREVARRWQGECDVMVISMFADTRHVMPALEAGATGYLLKDSSPLDVPKQIRELRAGGSTFSPLIARQLLERLVPSPNQKTSTPINPAALLSEREQTVLKLAAKGCSYVQIAEVLSISIETVRTYAKRCFQKLHVKSKTEAIYEARKMGIDLD